MTAGASGRGAAHQAECGDQESAQRRDAEVFSHFLLRCFEGRTFNDPRAPVNSTALLLSKRVSCGLFTLL